MFLPARGMGEKTAVDKGSAEADSAERQRPTILG